MTQAKWKARLHYLAFFSLVIILGACSAMTAQRLAENFGVIAEQVASEQFKHQVFRKQGEGKLLHVYIEGDGRPWKTPISVSTNPTPKNPIMLKLMVLDEAPSIYLGRPCYFKLDDVKCTNSQWWTTKRYAPEIIDSLNVALNNYAKHYQGIRLFGHSGGGTIAVLLARIRSDVLDLVTLAGNLDIDAWVKEHNYSPLPGSMNPANESSVAANVRQFHYVGTEDQIIPPHLVEAVVAKQLNAKLIAVDGYDHACCWDEVWKDILIGLDN